MIKLIIGIIALANLLVELESRRYFKELKNALKNGKSISK